MSLFSRLFSGKNFSLEGRTSPVDPETLSVVLVPAIGVESRVSPTTVEALFAPSMVYLEDRLRFEGRFPDISYKRRDITLDRFDYTFGSVSLGVHYRARPLLGNKADTGFSSQRNVYHGTLTFFGSGLPLFSIGEVVSDLLRADPLLHKMYLAVDSGEPLVHYDKGDLRLAEGSALARQMGLPDCESIRYDRDAGRWKKLSEEQVAV